MLMKYRVFARLLNLIKHIHCQDDETNLSKQILNQQLLNEWPGLSKTALKICNELNIVGLFNPQINKKQFKINVKRACRLKNDEDLISRIKTYKKMSAIRDETQKGNSYFYKETLQNARILFRFRTDMYESKQNFKHKAEYIAEKFLCDSCEKEVDHNTHVLFCDSYSTLRENKDINCDSDLAEYLLKVMEIRTKLRLDR